MRVIALVAAASFLASCNPSDSPTTADVETFVLASTTSTQDSGLLDLLIPRFEAAEPDYRVKVVAVGSGEALDLGRRGDADVLLVHSPDAELRFMKEGHGTSRQPVMQNDLVIAGPPSDPAGSRRAADAPDAMKMIAASESVFLSRGDRSGTHARELSVWEEADIDPSGDWYRESGQGMAETLAIAAELSAYLLTDTATLTVVSPPGLVVLFDNDPSLVNPYNVIVAASTRHRAAAERFASWITSDEGRRLISGFGSAGYGDPLFEVST